jgi:hypothetical protein
VHAHIHVAHISLVVLHKDDIVFVVDGLGANGVRAHDIVYMRESRVMFDKRVNVTAIIKFVFIVKVNG